MGDKKGESYVDARETRGFNWDSVRQRMTEAAVAIEESIDVSPEELREVWARRAAELAQLPSDEDEGEHIRLLLIQLGREVYGVDAQYVFNVKPAELITYVPRVPEWVAGVVNLRGRIFSVVDLRRFFGLPAAEIKKEDDSEYGESVDHLVVVETPDMEIALLVDDVLTVEPVPVNRIQDTSGTVRGLRPEYVRGVVTYGGEGADVGENGSMVVVLDLLALLADERLIVHEEIV
jgi:purine-binding chemotaxis protein CheW